MARIVEIDHRLTLDDYAAYAHLSPAVQALRDEAAHLVPRLADVTVWMVNSTAQGGGVAEMLPPMIGLFRDLGLDVRWIVIEADDPAFFVLTKRVHNLIHDSGDPHLRAGDRNLYDAVSRTNAEAIASMVRSDDILVVHDPQPLGVGALVKEATGATAVWNCHIGLDERTRATAAAWEFIRPYATAYDHSIFSAPEYIPDYLAGRATVIHPAVDPLSHKNRELHLHKLVGVLCDASLAVAHGPVLMPPFDEPARRLQPDGSFAPATVPEDLGLLFRPIITQVSRWDRLKGFEPLLRAFVRLKARLDNGGADLDDRHRRALEIVRLVMAGPATGSVDDDPEAYGVLQELVAAYRALDPRVQADVALITLPMSSRMANAFMVNALQRASTMVVQNSLREGFGLTATEAMWKRVPVIGTRAVGLRQQIRDGLDGRLVADPEDADALAATMDEMLRDPVTRDFLAHTAQRRVYDEFLVFRQLSRWMELLVETRGAARR